MNEKDRLRLLAAFFSTYDGEHTLDPFRRIHWGTVAAWERRGSVCVGKGEDSPNYGAVLIREPRGRKLQDFTFIPTALIKSGEIECPMFAYSPGGLEALIGLLRGEAVKGLWLTRVNQENPKNLSVLKALGAQLISVRVGGVGSDLYGIWYAGPGKRSPVAASEQLCFVRLGKRWDFAKIAESILAADMQFAVTSRGEKYGGPRKTWRRVDVRPSGSPPNIAREQLEHCFGNCAPDLISMLTEIAPLEELDQVLLTRVEPHDGCIKRHTDIALDRDKVRRGTKEGTFARFHLVLQSNPKCVFHIWDLEGNKCSTPMLSGEVWYTDVRKPHAVDNSGGCLRLHLVCDWKVAAGFWESLQSRFGFDMAIPGLANPFSRWKGKRSCELW